MNIIEKFSLIRDVPNILNLSKNEIDKNIAEDSSLRKLFTTLKVAENRISHYAKDKILDLLSLPETSKRTIAVLSLKEYPLIVSFNKPTNQAVINISYFGTNDVSYVNPKDLYAATYYSLLFSKIIMTKGIKESYITSIVNFLLSVFVRAFGKEFGLLGAYSKEIVKIKFLLSCYILKSFFNSSNIYKKAYSYSGFDYKPIEKELNSFDFSNILSFIDSLSKLNALPGISRYKFSSTFLKFLSLNFIPALEDCARFFSIMATSSLVGISILPTHLRYYNKLEYENILNIAKKVY